MYRPTTEPRERAATVTAVAAVHLLLALGLLNLSVVARQAAPGALTRLITIAPEPPVVLIDPAAIRPARKEAAASAKSIDSQASEVVAPLAPVLLPTPNPMVASPTPRDAAQATQGAAEVAGPGTGAGGAGAGDGSGGDGNGNGGGDGLAIVRARLATRTLDRHDFQSGLLERWPPEQQIFMRLRVGAEGQVIQCIVDIGSGDAGIDASVCATAQARLRFYPGVNREGRRVADWFGYRQRPL